MDKFCECGKRCFGSEREAKHAMRRVTGGDRLRTYRCTICRYVHFTSHAMHEGKRWTRVKRAQERQKGGDE